MIPKDIHKIADTMGVLWDGDKKFMEWCNSIVGKKHLDDMSEPELIMIYNRLKNRKYPESLNKHG